MNNTIKAGIIGGAGYTGGELIRLLLLHPNVEIVFVHSNSNAGKKIHTVHQDLLGQSQLVFTNSIDEHSGIDLLFLCLGHGDSTKFLAENTIDQSIKIIDVAKARVFDQHKSVSEIAYDLGFKYPQHFTRLFKQRVGVSPNEYRNLN